MDGGANPFRSMHRDVLDATPSDEYVDFLTSIFLEQRFVMTSYATRVLSARAGKEKLVTELRDRAKRSIEQKVQRHSAASDSAARRE
jgi:hypothetical protein